MSLPFDLANLTPKQRIELTRQITKKKEAWLTLCFAKMVKLGKMPYEIFAAASDPSEDAKNKVKEWFAKEGLAVIPLNGQNAPFIGAILTRQGKIIETLKINITSNTANLPKN